MGVSKDSSVGVDMIPRFDLIPLHSVRQQTHPLFLSPKSFTATSSSATYKEISF